MEDVFYNPVSIFIFVFVIFFFRYIIKKVPKNLFADVIYIRFIPESLIVK